MSGNQYFTAFELATNDSFKRWVLDSSTLDAEIWTDWLAGRPERWEVADQAIQLLLECDDYFNNISDAEIEEELFRLDRQMTGGALRPRISLAGWAKVAAAVLLVVSSFVLLKHASPQTDSPLPVAEETATIIQSGSTPVPVYLPDGSVVVLQPESKLVYGPEYGDSLRVVRLTGEAFFEVVRNVEKPFLVYTGTLLTKVLGTSFSVSAFENRKDAVVTVKTGRVAVSPLKKDTKRKSTIAEEGMILSANQEMIYRAEEARLIRRLVEDPELLEPTLKNGATTKFTFRNTPVKEVFRSLSEAYGVDIIYDEADLVNCYLTAVLEEEPLFEKLDLICRTIGGKHEQADGVVIVSSAGCQ